MHKSIGKSYAGLDTFAQGRTCLGKFGTSLGQRFRVLLALSFAVLLLSCDYETGSGGEIAGPPGVVGLSIRLNAANAVLFKTASGDDTIFNLDSLKVVLTATGSATQTYAYAISGDATNGSIAVPVKYYSVAPLITWKARIFSIDTTSDPSHPDTVHLDSVNFSVKPADSVFVPIALNARYSIVKARFLSTDSNSVPSTVKYIRLRVDGVTRDSMDLSAGYGAIGSSNGTNSYAVGALGAIVKTANTGTTWIKQTSNTNQNLNSIYVFGTNGAWVAGDLGIVLKVDGAAWKVQNIGGTKTNMNGISSNNSNSTAWAVGDSGKIFNTINGGSSWSAQTSGTTQNLNAAYVFNTSLVFAVGDNGTFLRTRNGGTNWVSKSTGTSQRLNSVAFASATIGWAVGDGGILLRSKDSGNTWTAQTSGTSQNLNGVSLGSTVPCAFIAGSGGVFLKTKDTGITWVSKNTGTNSNLGGLFFGDTRTSSNTSGWIVGSGGGIRYTTDTGNTWTAQTVGVNGAFYPGTFDQSLSYKYLTPNVSHTLLLQAIDTTAGPLRGYEATRTVNLSPGKDSTLSTTSLDKCGYSGYPACTP